MKKNILLVLILITSTLSFAQNPDLKSDLRVKIDSIIKYEIQYVIDSATNVIPSYKFDSIRVRGMYPAVPSLPPNPMTLVLFEGEAVRLKELNKYTLEEIKKIDVYPLSDRTAMAIYGQRAKNGMIVISVKK